MINQKGIEQMDSKPITDESLAKKCSLMAEQYDKDKETHLWNGPNVIFGLSYGYVNQGESILDIGIGTGLGSLLFHKAGLKVYGMDLSQEMLSVCEKKGIAEKLSIHDLTKIPYPYRDSSVNHAICVGVLNHFENIEPVFMEAFRILKDKGIFGFIVADRKNTEKAMFEVQHANSCHRMFRHSTDDIQSLISKYGFCSLRELEFIISGHGEKGGENRLKAYVAGKGMTDNS